MNYLDIKIYPNKSLTKSGLTILMAFFLLPALLIGSDFSIKGAWPVAGFLGLELLLIYCAFKVSFANNDIYEHITLDENEFKIVFYGRKQEIKSISIEPTWIKVDLGYLKNNSRFLSISSHGKKNLIGKFLSAYEMEIIAKKITYGLHMWKRKNYKTS